MSLRTPLMAVFLLNLIAGGLCRDQPQPAPADQAGAESATDEVHRLQRLRDADRLRQDSEREDWVTQTAALRGVASLLALGQVVTLVWLMVEIRRRRVLAAVLLQWPPRPGAGDSGAGSAGGAATPDS